MSSLFGPTDKIAILGQSGSGKTYLSQRVQSVFPRVVVIDFMQEYRDGDVVTSFQQFSEKLLEYKISRRKRFRIIFQFPPETEDFSFLCDQILKTCYTAGNLLVVIEEVQNYSHPHNLPHWLRTSLLTGRHKNIAMIFTTQRPGELHKTILSQCAHIFCGRVHEKNDLKYLENYFHDEIEKVQKLENRFFLFWRPGLKTALVHNSLGPVKNISLEKNSAHPKP